MCVNLFDFVGRVFRRVGGTYRARCFFKGSDPKSTTQRPKSATQERSKSATQERPKSATQERPKSAQELTTKRGRERGGGMGKV